MTDSDKERSTRGEALYAAHNEKVRAFFEGQKFKILKEVHLGEDEKFATPFGNKGRHGVIIENLETGKRDVVGWTILRRAAAQYGSVDLPPEQQKRKRRSKAEKAADDARKAAEKEQERLMQEKLIEDILNRSQDEKAPAQVSDSEESETDEKEENPSVVSGLFS